MQNENQLIEPHGGYRNLMAFQMAEIVCDGTVKFCDRFISKFSRTKEQMLQAARSGKQNIAEGSKNSGTSKKTELKLIGVARGSLEELLLDYEDYIRQNNLNLWGKDDIKSKNIRNIAYTSNRSYQTYSQYIEHSNAEIAANTIICLIHQTNYLLDQLLRRLAKDFIEKGGFTERLYEIRKKRRNNNFENDKK